MSLGPLGGMRVVDLYAGSGALAIEALSRGAAFADLVDDDRRAREAIDQNLDALELRSRAKVWPLRLPQGLKRLWDVLATADVVFADPPYGGGDARAILALLGETGGLREGTRVVLERHGKDEVPSVYGTLELARERRYGETVINLYRSGGASADPPEAGRA